MCIILHILSNNFKFKLEYTAGVQASTTNDDIFGLHRVTFKADTFHKKINVKNRVYIQVL